MEIQFHDNRLYHVSGSGPAIPSVPVTLLSDRCVVDRLMRDNAILVAQNSQLSGRLAAIEQTLREVLEKLK